MENNFENQKKVEELLDKMSRVKKGTADLSSDEDLSLAIMNLVSIEEHFFFTGAKSKKPEYFDLLDKVRGVRGELMRKIVKEPEGEVWCISKHLLAATMRLMEVGTKYLSKGDSAMAQDLFYKAYDLYNLFWGINLKLIDIGEIKKIDDEALNEHDVVDKKSLPAGRQGFLGKLGEMVEKLVNCCKE